MMFKLRDRFSQKFLVSNEIYQGFLFVFNDSNPLHTIDEFATGKGFKGKVIQVI